MSSRSATRDLYESFLTFKINGLVFRQTLSFFPFSHRGYREPTMTAPRVSLEDTPWYHCVCRCVRRAFLCGEEQLSGMNFDHRRGWIVKRIQQLATLFAIDVAAYAVMSNHYHIMVRIDRERALEWSLEEVLRCWTVLFTEPLLVTRYLSDSRAEMSQAEIAKVEELAACKHRGRNRSSSIRETRVLAVFQKSFLPWAFANTAKSFSSLTSEGSWNHLAEIRVCAPPPRRPHA